MSANIYTDCNNTKNIEPDFNVSGKQQKIHPELKNTLKKQQKDRINKKINQRLIKKLDMNFIYDKVPDEYLIEKTQDNPNKLQNTPILKRQAQKYDNYC